MDPGAAAPRGFYSQPRAFLQWPLLPCDKQTHELHLHNVVSRIEHIFTNIFTVSRKHQARMNEKIPIEKLLEWLRETQMYSVNLIYTQSFLILPYQLLSSGLEVGVDTNVNLIFNQYEYYAILIFIPNSQ